MSWIDVVRYRLRVLTRSADRDRESADEIAFHVELETMQRRHAAPDALSEDQARDAARRRFGNVTYYREEARRISGITAFEAIGQDLRFGLRTLRRAPTFTVVAALTLAIGIGANTAIFSAVDALLLRPLPYRHPEQLMSLSLSAPGSPERPGARAIPWSYPKFRVFRDAQTVFSSVTVWMHNQYTVRADDEAWRVDGEYVDSHYFSTIGVSPAMGRGFRADEDIPHAEARVTVISSELWVRMYNADPAVLGKRLDVDGAPFTIIGVMPPKFRGLSGGVYFWMPVGSMATKGNWGSEEPYNHILFALGRLAPGVSRERASAIVRELGARVDAAFPDQVPGRHWSATASEIDAVRVDPDVRRTLYILLGAVGLVLLIACVNVANLFLVRASGRRREIAVRLAIGAGRWRLIRQLLVESLLLSFLGGIVSVAVAYAGIHSLVLLQPEYALGTESNAGISPANFGEMTINGAALGFAAVLVIATGVLFGLVPALQATRPSLTETLKDDGAARTGRLRRLTSQNLLTVVEIALAVVLLAGSGLLVHSLARLMGVRPGVDTEHVLTMRINRAPSWSKDSLTEFYDRSLAALAAIPGVTDAAIGDMPPLAGGSVSTMVMLRDRPPAALGHRLHAGIHYITPGWPAVLHVPLLRGRLFTRGDVPNTRKVVLVNETAARTYWPGQDPIGRPISLAEWSFARDTAYVVGVVGDVKFSGIGEPFNPDVYISYYQLPFSWRMMMFMRTQGDPQSYVKAAREALRRAAPGFPVYAIRSMEDLVSLNVAASRFSALLLSLFAALALLLATVGTYGVISFTVAQRTREIGVRVALGATRTDVIRMILRQGMVLASVGAAGGLICAAMSVRLLKSMLFGVEPSDPATLAGIIGVLVLAVVAASWIPARRAASVPAMQALRGD